MGRALLGGRMCEPGDLVCVHPVGVHQAEVPGHRGGVCVGSHSEHSGDRWGLRVRFIRRLLDRA
jgi:hypothetical protein